MKIQVASEFLEFYSKQWWGFGPTECWTPSEPAIFNSLFGSPSPPQGWGISQYETEAGHALGFRTTHCVLGVGYLPGEKTHCYLFPPFWVSSGPTSLSRSSVFPCSHWFHGDVEYCPPWLRPTYPSYFPSELKLPCVKGRKGNWDWQCHASMTKMMPLVWTREDVPRHLVTCHTDSLSGLFIFPHNSFPTSVY